MKLARLEHIFITQPVWRHIGGLPGTALTIQDVGVPQITLHGPHGLVSLYFNTVDSRLHETADVSCYIALSCNRVLMIQKVVCLFNLSTRNETNSIEILQLQLIRDIYVST